MAYKRRNGRKSKRSFYNMARKALYNSVKNRYTDNKGIKFAQVAKDVMMIKSLINVEKKRVVTNSTAGTNMIGQCDNTSSGHYLLDCTPAPAQGLGYNQRTGNSIKWTSSHYDIQVVQQSATAAPIKLKYYFVKVVGLPYSTISGATAKFLNSNPFVTGGTIYDYNSARNPDYFKDFVVLKSGEIKIDPDPQSSITMIKSFKIGFKLNNHHVKWSLDTSTVSQGQVFLLIVADNGNISSTTVSTLGGVPVTAINTGVTFNYIRTDYFVDN